MTFYRNCVSVLFAVVLTIMSGASSSEKDTPGTQARLISTIGCRTKEGAKLLIKAAGTHHSPEKWRAALPNARGEVDSKMGKNTCKSRLMVVRYEEEVVTMAATDTYGTYHVTRVRVYKTYRAKDDMWAPVRRPFRYYVPDFTKDLMV